MSRLSADLSAAQARCTELSQLPSQLEAAMREVEALEQQVEALQADAARAAEAEKQSQALKEQLEQWIKESRETERALQVNKVGKRVRLAYALRVCFLAFAFRLAPVDRSDPVPPFLLCRSLRSSLSVSARNGYRHAPPWRRP